MDRPKVPNTQPDLSGGSQQGDKTRRPPNLGDKATRPPNIERNEPVIKYKSAKKGGGAKKGTQDEKEKLVVRVS